MPHGQDSSVVVAGGQYAMKQKHRLFGFIWGITLFSPLSISINFRWTPRLSSDSSSFFSRPSMNFCISWVWRCALLLCWGYLSRFFEPSVGCSTCGCFSSVSSKLLWGLNIVFGCFCCPTLLQFSQETITCSTWRSWLKVSNCCTCCTVRVL